MRRLSLTVLLLAAPVFAQEAAEPSAPPSPAAAAPASQEAPATAEPAPEAQGPATAAPGEAPAAAAEQAPPPARRRRSKPAPKPAAKAAKPAPRAPEPKAAEPSAPEPPKVAEPAAPEPATPGTLSPRERVAEEARVFFALLLTGDVRALSFRLDLPFQLEGRRFGDNEELVSEWVRSLRQRRTDLVTLYDIEVLTPEEMERKHGAPPKRLGTLDYRGPNTYVAVANLSGRAAVAVFRISQGAVKAVAYTD